MKRDVWQRLIEGREGILRALRKNQPLVFLSSVSIVVAGFLYALDFSLAYYFLVSFGFFLFATLFSVGMDVGILKKEEWPNIFYFFFFLAVGTFSSIIGSFKALNLVQIKDVPEVGFLIILFYIILFFLLLLKADYPALKMLAISYKRLRKIFKKETVKGNQAIYLKMVLFFSFYIYIIAHLYVGIIILSLLKYYRLSNWEWIVFELCILLILSCFAVTTEYLKKYYE